MNDVISVSVTEVTETVNVSVSGEDSGFVAVSVSEETSTTNVSVSEKGRIGPAGANGINGVDGAPGADGQDGATGPQGLQGDTGPAGPQGLQGDAGDTGPAGPQGPQGDTGPAGATGPAGPQGDTGPQGIQGPQGDAGPAGADGIQGPTGPAGAVGATGPQGIQGEKGDTGDTGPQGPTGPAGADGVGSGDMVSANNLSDVASTTIARANLGANDAANLTTGLLLAGRIPRAELADAQAGLSNTLIMTPLRTAQAIAALAPSGGGTVYRCVLDGIEATTWLTETTNQVVWTTTTKVDAGFTYDGLTGEVTIGSALDGVWSDFNISITVDRAARTMVRIHLQQDTGSGFATIHETSNYTTRTTGQNRGSAHMPSRPIQLVDGHKYRIQVYFDADATGTTIIDTGCFWSIRTDPV